MAAKERVAAESIGCPVQAAADDDSKQEVSTSPHAKQ